MCHTVQVVVIAAKARIQNNSMTQDVLERSQRSRHCREKAVQPQQAAAPVILAKAGIHGPDSVGKLAILEVFRSGL